MSDVPSNARDELAAKYFPVEWARLVNVPGKSKARQKLRQRAEVAQKIEGLRAQSAACKNCGSYCTRPVFGMESHGAHCERMSDFEGYVFTKPDDLCVNWRAP